MLACSLINTRLDYCNSLYVGTSSHSIARLQRDQNNLARVVLKINRYASISNYIHALHWLRIPERLDYKIATLTFKALNTGLPLYLATSISMHLPVRSLRSASRHILNTPHCSLKCALPAFLFSHVFGINYRNIRNCHHRLTFLSLVLRLNYFHGILSFTSVPCL